MNLKVADAKREEGFTLIELLVVVIIIGILAAIAIPVFLNQRAQAWERAAQSDARNAAVALESYFNDHFEYPTDADFGGDYAAPDITGTATLGEESITASPQITIEYGPGASTGGATDPVDSFALCITHDQIDEGAYTAIYDSSAGGLLQDVDRSNVVTGDCEPAGTFTTP